MNRKTIMSICVAVAIVLLLAVVAMLLLKPGKSGEQQEGTTTVTTTLTLLPGEEIYDPSVMEQEDTQAQSTDTTPVVPDATQSQSGNDSATQPQTKPVETKPEETQPLAPPATQPDTQPTGPDTGLTYEEYIALTGPEQVAYMQSFANTADYFAWYNKAKAEYDNKEVHDSDGSINLGDFLP